MPRPFSSSANDSPWQNAFAMLRHHTDSPYATFYNDALKREINAAISARKPYTMQAAVVLGAAATESANAAYRIHLGSRLSIAALSNAMDACQSFVTGADDQLSNLIIVSLPARELSQREIDTVSRATGGKLLSAHENSLFIEVASAPIGPKSDELASLRPIAIALVWDKIKQAVDAETVSPAENWWGRTQRWFHRKNAA